MNSNSDSLSKKNSTDPTSRNYAKRMKNKGNENSPYGENEPSPHTEFKNDPQ